MDLDAVEILGEEAGGEVAHEADQGEHNEGPPLSGYGNPSYRMCIGAFLVKL
jgi:hypothetical protein